MKRAIAVLMSLIFVSSFCINSKADVTAEYLRYVEEISSEYNICPELVESIIYYESRWNPKATNKFTGCQGFGQINPKVHKARAKKLGVKDLYDPRGNILVMCDYLAELFEEYEDVATVLMIYSEGYNGLKRANKGITSQHVMKILNMSWRLEEEHNKCGGVG